MDFRAGIRLLTLPVLLVAVVACSGTNDSEVGSISKTEIPTSAEVQQQPAGPDNALSRVRDYHSITELTTYSDLVVRVRGTKKIETTTDLSMPHTITDFDVIEVVRGSAPEKVRVRQVGSPESEHILKSNGSYLLFLRNSERAPGQYVIVGTVAGIFSDNSGMVTRLDPYSTDIPEKVQLDSLRADVIRAPERG
ncbi:SH2 domain-containing protein [Frankia sp. AgKG'84/4]|uniref:hypothetical protein n=1 Tax=Frankia sp. AgKG'84/4 TaxID=573490 RepID=UPI00200CB68D|nr:hypothetical protein [Frankia sp. AgKG'84/4]MCL9792889.1 hypothetical protein [Frankia sp. AgKG'84/4]